MSTSLPSHRRRCSSASPATCSSAPSADPPSSSSWVPLERRRYQPTNWQTSAACSTRSTRKSEGKNERNPTALGPALGRTLGLHDTALRLAGNRHRCCLRRRAQTRTRRRRQHPIPPRLYRASRHGHRAHADMERPRACTVTPWLYLGLYAFDLRSFSSKPGRLDNLCRRAPRRISIAIPLLGGRSLVRRRHCLLAASPRRLDSCRAPPHAIRPLRPARVAADPRFTTTPPP